MATPRSIVFFSWRPGYCCYLSRLFPCAVLLMSLKEEHLKYCKQDHSAAGRLLLANTWVVLIVVLIALLPTIIYFFSIQALSSGEGIDTGAAIGSYIGLFFLAAVFTAIGVCISSFTNNAVVAFIISLIACALLYYGFNAISQLSLFEGGADYYIEMLGIDFHYRSISRGVIDTRDIVYFLSVIFLFLTITDRNLLKR